MRLLRRCAPRNDQLVAQSVIASEAQPSVAIYVCLMDCFAALAMTTTFM